MSVLFIHPPIETTVSGGNLYNQHIIEQSSENNYPLHSLPIRSRGPSAQLAGRIAELQPGVVVWDSILSTLSGIDPPVSSAYGTVLLVHYLPSLNPNLDAASVSELAGLEMSAARSCERLICTGTKIFEILAARHPEKPLFLCKPGVAEIFFPAALEHPRRAPKEPIELISVANLRREKGYCELLEVLYRLKSHKWTWHIVGSEHDDPAFSRLFRLKAIDMDLMPRIEFHGVLNPKQLAILLREMDLFINASYFESYGMALAEAVASGLPAVSTRTGEAEELVSDGNSGVLVPTGVRDTLRSALSQVLQQPELLWRFRLEARKITRRSWKMCFEHFRDACESMR